MAPQIDPVDLAAEIAEIASTTSDPETARRLLELAGRLLTQAGLPDTGPGGGEPSPGSLHAAQADEPEFA